MGYPTADMSQSDIEAYWTSVHSAGTAKAMKSYHAAARKIVRMMRDLATGSENLPEIHRALDKLGSSARKPEIRGDSEANEAAYAIEKELRRIKTEAEEAGRLARRAANDAEIARLKQAERDARARMDPALRAYQDELTLMSGRR
jgi:hypothetical protein